MKRVTDWISFDHQMPPHDKQKVLVDRGDIPQFRARYDARLKYFEGTDVDQGSILHLPAEHTCWRPDHGEALPIKYGRVSASVPPYFEDPFEDVCGDDKSVDDEIDDLFDRSEWPPNRVR